MLVYRACGDPATDDPTQDLDEISLDSLVPPSKLVTDVDAERFVYETQLVENMQKREEMQVGLSMAKLEMENCLKQLVVHPKGLNAE